MGIKIITDSACDMTVEEAKDKGIVLMPLTVTFGEESFKDGVELSHEGFFEKLIETDELPTTSQIAPFDYEQEFTRAVENGDEVLCITISSKLSGCFQSANIAAEEARGNIAIVDSGSASIGQRILVELAASLREKGMSLEEMAQTLEKEKENIRVIALLDTLEYLKKGGRISAAVAMAGTMLNIKPVIAIENGEVGLLGQARGSKKGNNKLIELIQKEGGIDFSKPCALTYAGLSRSLLDKYIEDSKELYRDYEGELTIGSVGCAIGTHIGPGAIGAAFFV